MAYHNLLYFTTKTFCFTFILSSLLQTTFGAKYGVLIAKTDNMTKENEFCTLFFPEFKDLPTEKQNIMEWGEMHYINHSLCDSFPKLEIIKRNKTDVVYVVATLGNCSLSEQAKVVKDADGSGLILAAPVDMEIDNIQYNYSSANSFDMVVALISNNTALGLKHLGSPLLGLYSPGSYFLDYSLGLVWCISVAAVTIGSWWSGLVRHSLRKRLHDSALSPSNSVPSSMYKMEEESALDISPLLVLFFVFIMGTILILLYFFYKYLVYLILALFVCATILSLYGCFESLIRRLNCARCKLSIAILGIRGELWQVLLLAIAASISITWLIYRKHPYSWILQNILGLFFCINMLKSIRLPSFKICTVLLSLLFIYDIFFVFITPFFTMVMFSAQKGESVMVQVATGGKSQEQLPMVFRVPHTWTTALALCHYQQFSILGYGDILVPGLLVSYCHGFDLLIGAMKRPYYILTSTAYGLGMIFTFLGLYLMATPQPALLYLVPSILIPPVILAWCRGELAHFWYGENPVHKNLQVVESSPVLTDAVS